LYVRMRAAFIPSFACLPTFSCPLFLTPYHKRRARPATWPTRTPPLAPKHTSTSPPTSARPGAPGNWGNTQQMLFSKANMRCRLHPLTLSNTLPTACLLFLLTSRQPQRVLPRRRDGRVCAVQGWREQRGRRRSLRAVRARHLQRRPRLCGGESPLARERVHINRRHSKEGCIFVAVFLLVFADQRFVGAPTTQTPQCLPCPIGSFSDATGARVCTAWCEWAVCIAHSFRNVFGMHVATTALVLLTNILSRLFLTYLNEHAPPHHA
jgi:hypothetical protein